MRRKIMALIMSAGLLCSCSSTASVVETPTAEEKVTTTAVETTITETTTESLTEEETTEEETSAVKREFNFEREYEQEMSIVERSLLSTGNNARFNKLFDKAAAGEEITVGYIGGSITYGHMVTKAQRYATIYTEWLKGALGTEVREVNAGISGTPSVLGNLRVENEVLAEKPDLVVVEFAVNDGGDNVYKNSYESLVNRILKAENEPAVLLLFTVTESGHSCEPWMKQIGEHYELPMVSVVQSMKAEVDAGNIAFTDYSNDGVHPNEIGHKWILDYLAYATKKIHDAERSESYSLPERAAIAKYYEDLTLYTRANITADSMGSWTDGKLSNFSDTFEHGWRRNPGEENEPLVFKTECRVLFVLFKEVPKTATDYGTIDIYVDGELIKSINSITANGWHDPTYKLIFEEIDSKEHTIEIKAQEGSENKYFDLLGLAWM